MRPDDERRVAQEMMAMYHSYGVGWLTLADDPDAWFARCVRRWVQRIKTRLIDGRDPAELEVRERVDRAIARALHPEHVLSGAGFVIRKENPRP